jgi:hypothetical protein
MPELGPDPGASSAVTEMVVFLPKEWSYRQTDFTVAFAYARRFKRYPQIPESWTFEQKLNIW